MHARGLCRDGWALHDRAQRVGLASSARCGPSKPRAMLQRPPPGCVAWSEWHEGRPGPCGRIVPNRKRQEFSDRAHQRWSDDHTGCGEGRQCHTGSHDGLKKRLRPSPARERGAPSPGGKLWTGNAILVAAAANGQPCTAGAQTMQRSGPECTQAPKPPLSGCGT